MIDLRNKQLFLFDLDGVFYKGKEKPTKIGGDKILARLRSTGKKILVLSNDSTDSREKVARNLSKLGLDINIGEILTSAMLTALYVRQKYRQGATYFLVGESGLERELEKAGLRRTMSSDASVVVVGLDRNLTYAKLDKAAKVALAGAPIVATHRARMYMYKNGPAVATGPIVAALEYAASKRAISIGKPSTPMFEFALKMGGNVRRKYAVMVGDQLDTDIEGANNAKIDSILVKTGVHQRGTRNVKPSATVKNVDELARYV